jgi:hypothetical protein
MSSQILLSNLLIVQIKLFNRIIPNLNLLRPHKSAIIQSTTKITFSLHPSSSHLKSAPPLILTKKKTKGTLTTHHSSP